MKVQFKLNDQLTFELEGDTTKALFERIAEVTDVFDNPPKDGGKVRYRVRHVTNDKGKEFTYYEAVEDKIGGGRLAYGVYQDLKKGIFPKKRGEDGEWLANNGYVVWKPEDKE